MNDTIGTEKVTVAYLQKEAGWGPWIKVTIADTPEADKAAAAFFKRATEYRGYRDYHTASVDEEASTALGEAMAEIFYPTCEHGMSADLCMGPDHYPTREQEMQMGW
jgi:hypothetical protein